MEVLTEEESRLVMENMFPSFTCHSVDGYDLRRSTSGGQKVLLIHGPGQDYKVQENHDIPSLSTDDEILVKVIVIGLNPIDWKGPDFNFGLPSLPWINGRDLAGVVVKAHRNLKRIRVGDVVLSPSTDYRDIRKGAFQEYAVTAEHNTARIPSDLPIHNAAVLGVAFVAASLSLGICLGVNFSMLPNSIRGPDLFHLVREVSSDSLAADIKDECLAGVSEEERAKPGDWIAIWGASSATGLIALQLAKLAQLRAICVVDVARHGERLLEAGADLLVDRFDVDRAVSIIRGVTRGRLRFALDTIGRETAENLEKTLSSSETGGTRSHLVGLANLPKTKPTGILHHKVPIKAFHDVHRIGDGLMTWLEKLLLAGKLLPPETETAVGGLSGINEALDSLRKGSVAGKRLVVSLEKKNVTAVVG